MSYDGLVVLVLLLINLIIAIVYLLIHLRKKDMKRGFTNFFFMLVFPIVGEVFTLLAWVAGYALRELAKQGLDFSELSFSKERMKLLTDADIEAELNTVPIEEALIVADKSNKRSAFINVLKSDDFEDMMTVINDAVSDDDMEVSHYAASFVTDSMAKFKEKEAQMRKQVDSDGSLQNLKQYVDFMEQNLKPEIFSNVELKVYVELLDKSSRILYERSPGELKDQTISLIVNLWFALGREEKAIPWIEKARVRFRDSLECFKLCADYYYRTGNRTELAAIFKEIKRYSVPLDSEALGWIRFFRFG